LGSNPVKSIWPSQSENARLGREYLDRYADILHRGGDREWVGQYLKRNTWRCEADAVTAAALLGDAGVEEGRIFSTGGAPFVFEFLLRRRFSGELVSRVEEPLRLSTVAEDLNLRTVPMSLQRPDPDAIAGLGQFHLIALRQPLGVLQFDLPATLKQLRELLLPNGVLHICAANGGRLRRILTRRTTPKAATAYRYQPSRRAAEIPETSYSEAELRDLLEHAGLQVDSVSYRNRLPYRGGRRRLRQSLTAASPSLRDEIVVTAHRPEGA
jgi:hypothetical protein